MQTKTVYLVVKVKVEFDENKFDLEDAGLDDLDDVGEYIASEIGNNCDYSIVYNENGVRVLDTEITWAEDYHPID